jgi:hypothetical protein
VVIVPQRLVGVGVVVPDDLAALVLRGLELVVARERPTDTRVGLLAAVLVAVVADPGGRCSPCVSPGWLTSAEYAAREGITERAARHRAATGLVAAERKAGRWRIDPT